MFTLYTVLLSLHIMAVVIWIGGGATLVTLMVRMRGEREPAVLAGLLRNGAVIGQRVYAPASLVVVAAGFGLVAKGDWDFKLWLILGVIFWLAAAVHGAAYMGRQSEKLSEEITAGAVDAQAVGARLSTIVTHGYVELAILLLIIADMVIKPGT